MKKLFCITILLSLMLLLASCGLGPVSIEISDSTASNNSSGWKTSDSIISLVYFDGVTRVIFKPVN